MIFLLNSRTFSHKKRLFIAAFCESPPAKSPEPRSKYKTSTRIKHMWVRIKGECFAQAQKRRRSKTALCRRECEVIWKVYHTTTLTRSVFVLKKCFIFVILMTISFITFYLSWKKRSRRGSNGCGRKRINKREWKHFSRGFRDFFNVVICKTV